MVSTVSHVLRGDGDVFTAVVSCGFALYVLGIKPTIRSSILACIGLAPLLFVPDFNINPTQFISEDCGIWYNLVARLTSPAGVLATVAAILVAKLLRRPTPLDETYIVDESKCKSFKMVGSGRLPEMEEIPLLVQEMRESYNSGVSKPLAKRREQLRALLRFFEENEEDIVEALQKDLGRPRVEALYYDNFLPKAEIESALKNLDEWTSPKPVGFHILSFPSTQYTRAEPMGVALVIGTWNFPFLLSLNPLAGAIAAGNTVVLKPCMTSKHSAQLMAERLPKYVDPRIVSVVGTNFEGDRHCTAKLLEQRFDKIFFTGSPAVGRVILAGAAKHLTPCTLELGGKNPVIVDKTADVDMAARRTVWGRCLNAGQQCIAPDFVLCEESVVDEFCKSAAKHIPLLFGDKPADNGNFGRIVGDKQMQRIAGLLDNHGGQAYAGGTYDMASRYVPPTVIKCDVNSPLMGEEIFGPILAVVPVKSVDQAIAMVNEREKPLALYLFTGSKAVENRVVNNTSSGGVTVNHCIFHVGHTGLPFGGIGNSGMGAYHGKHTFDTFSHEKPVLVKSIWKDFGIVSDPFFVYPPWDKTKEKIARLVSPYM